jgi:hypothetical protein
MQFLSSVTVIPHRNAIIVIATARHPASLLPAPQVAAM